MLGKERKGGGKVMEREARRKSHGKRGRGEEKSWKEKQGGKVMEREARRKSHGKRSSTLHAREANQSTDLYY